MLPDLLICQDIYNAAFVRTVHLLEANVVLYSSPWPTYYISNIDQHCCHGNSLSFGFLRAQWRRILSRLTWFTLGLHKDNATLILTLQSLLVLSFLHSCSVSLQELKADGSVFSPLYLQRWLAYWMFANTTHHCSCLCHASDFLAKPLRYTWSYTPIVSLICILDVFCASMRAGYDFP